MQSFTEFLSEAAEIERGLSLSLRGKTLPPEDVVARIATGRATVKDIFACINTNDVGKWWMPTNQLWSVRPVDFARPQGDSLALQWKRWSTPRSRKTWFGNVTDYSKWFYGSLGVVLIAKNPMRRQESGYAYTQSMKLSLLRIRYNAGNGWKTLKAAGYTVNVVV